MKMAKASKADLDMAMTLANYLDSLSRSQMPDAISNDAEKIEWLDSDDGDQCARLLNGLRTVLNKGSINRVIWGMAVVCDPVNKCIDPDADTIEVHQEWVKAAEQRDELCELIKCLRSYSWTPGNIPDEGRDHPLYPGKHDHRLKPLWDAIDAAAAARNGGVA